MGKKEAIIKATLALVSSHGLEGVSTALIAKEANIGMGTLYRYFESKEQLLEDIFGILRKRMLRVIMEGMATPDSSMYQQFRSIVTKLTWYYVEHQYDFQFLQKYSDSSYMKGSYLDDHAIILTPISSILESGGDDFKFKNLPVHMIFGMIYGPMIAMLQLSHINKVKLDERTLEVIIEGLWQSITQPRENNG